MTDGDSQLLDRVRRGHEVAFETLFLRHYGSVYRVLYGLLREHEWAEDLAQETFLELYHNPPRIVETSLLAWLCRVALNRGYNRLRGKERERQRIERASTHQFTYYPDPSVEVLRASEGVCVREVLARLPERQSKLLLLRHAGLSYGECAVVLGVAPGSIGTLLARAERAFQKAYTTCEQPKGLLEGEQNEGNCQAPL